MPVSCEGLFFMGYASNSKPALCGLYEIYLAVRKLASEQDLGSNQSLKNQHTNAYDLV